VFERIMLILQQPESQLLPGEAELLLTCSQLATARNRQ